MSLADVIGLFIPICWLIWACIWIVASRNVKPTERSEQPLSRLSNTLPIWLAAFFLIVPHSWLGVLSRRVLPHGIASFGIGALLVVAGLGFAIWARYHIGRNWSGVITVKEDHTLVKTGPYALVRHPIYSGLLLAILGSAIARGHIGGILAIALILYAILRRVRIEEHWMAETFGQDYVDYAASTPALAPFIWL